MSRCGALFCWQAPGAFPLNRFHLGFRFPGVSGRHIALVRDLWYNADTIGA